MYLSCFSKTLQTYLLMCWLCFQVPKNLKIIDYIYTRFRVSTKQENIFGDSHDYMNNIEKWYPTSFITPMSQTCLEGSSTGSCFSSDPVLDMMKPKRISRKWADSSNIILGKRSLRNRPAEENGQYKSKNLVTERNRRKRIKDGIFTLRALVPNISKVLQKTKHIQFLSR